MDMKMRHIDRMGVKKCLKTISGLRRAQKAPDVLWFRVKEMIGSRMNAVILVFRAERCKKMNFMAGFFHHTGT
jgi:hypothetical protein